MGLCMISLALTSCLTLSLIFHSIQAQNQYYSLECGTVESPQDFLDIHNAVRATVGVGPLTWNTTVAAYAQNYAQRQHDCNLVHSRGPYGENLAMGSGQFSGVYAVKLWVSEQSDYDYNSNSCVGGRVCGHYTQVVWRKSVRLGCARVQCNNGWWFVTCNYDPPGNFVGQRPY